MKRFVVIKTPDVITPFNEREEITSGSLSLFDHVRIPVAGDYLYLGEDLGVYEVDWVLFNVDSGEIVIAATFDWRELRK
jgi:hypothetical protein